MRLLHSREPRIASIFCILSNSSLACRGPRQKCCRNRSNYFRVQEVSSPIVYNSLVAATLSARACLKAKSAWQWRVLTLGPEPCPSGDIRAAAEQIGPKRMPSASAFFAVWHRSGGSEAILYQQCSGTDAGSNSFDGVPIRYGTTFRCQGIATRASVSA